MASCAPLVPPWVCNPRAKVLEIVINWIIGGIREALIAVVRWILTLFEVAIIQPTTAAGQSLLDAFGPVGDAFIDLAYGLSAPLRQAAGSGPLAPIVTAFLSAVVLVTVAYLARGIWVFAKTVTWK